MTETPSPKPATSGAGSEPGAPPQAPTGATEIQSTRATPATQREAGSEVEWAGPDMGQGLKCYATIPPLTLLYTVSVQCNNQSQKLFGLKGVITT